jgi:hypothetical protein
VREFADKSFFLLLATEVASLFYEIFKKVSTRAKRMINGIFYRRQSSGLTRGEKPDGDFPYFVKPCPAFSFCARYDDSKHRPVENGDPTESADAGFPDPFERVSEEFLFALLWCVGGVKDNRRPGREEAFRDPLPRIRFRKPVCYARTENPVNPSFEDRWRHSPPVGVNNNDTVCNGDFRTAPGDVFRQCCSAGDLKVGQDRIKPFCIEIMEIYFMIVLPECAIDDSGDRVVETSMARVGEDYRDLHPAPGALFRAVALKNV